MNLRQKFAAALFPLLALSPALATSATSSDTIRMVHGQGTGGTTDALARVLAGHWAKRLDKNVVVESRPGAATSLAAALVAKAPPNGETVLFTASGHTANPFLLSDLPYDTAKDFRAVGLVASTPYVLVVTNSLPVSTPKELVEYLKKHPEQASVGVTSIGSAQHISAALFRKMAGIDEMVYVPYKGSAGQLSDLISGRVPVAFDNIVAIASQIKAGTIKPLAVTSKTRSALFPDIPTLEESGYAGFDIVGWFGALVTADTPDEIVQAYSKATKEMKADPEFAEQLKTLGADAMPGGAEEAETFVQAELKKTGELIKDLNISLQ
jgi:tripartite-type tricarboxylate transporter receptor subunit TctC